MAGVGALVVSVRSAMRKEWRRCVIALALPIVLLVVALDPIGFVRSCNHIGDVIHFIVAKPYYDREIAALPADRGPRLVVFDWGGMVWASIGLVYDETDQVSLPRARQSADWLAQASHSELSCEGYGVQPLWDHYYLAEFPLLIRLSSARRVGANPDPVVASRGAAIDGRAGGRDGHDGRRDLSARHGRATGARRRSPTGRKTRASPCSSSSITRRGARTTSCTATPRPKRSCPRSSAPRPGRACAT